MLAIGQNPDAVPADARLGVSGLYFAKPHPGFPALFSSPAPGENAIKPNNTLGFSGMCMAESRQVTHTGRFMTPDWSAAPAAIPYASLANPQSLNLYTYTLDNPVTNTDPDGHWCYYGMDTTCVKKQNKHIKRKIHEAIDVIKTMTSMMLASQVAGMQQLVNHPKQSAVQIGLALVPGGEFADVAEEAATASIEESNINLNKSLASQEQMSGQGKAIAGVGTDVPLRQAERLAQEYGGSPEDWTKMTSSSYKAVDGQQFQTNWYENVRTGQRVKFKTKI